MANFTIYAGIIGEELFTETKEFSTEEDALDYAYGIATDKYRKDPDATVEDIMAEEEVDLETATEIFNENMDEAIGYFVVNEDEDEDDDDWNEDLIEADED